jgi:hypothetical protein
MRRWGAVITIFYAIILVTLLLPAATVLGSQPWPDFDDLLHTDDLDTYLWVAMLVLGQALLFVRVDRSWRKLRPRTHVAITAAMMASATALLFFAAITSLLAAVSGDQGRLATAYDLLFSNFSLTVLALWALWAAVFNVYYLRAPHRMANAVYWLVRGSILELLVAVPAHVVVRRRHDCSAPGVTAFGIVTGTAVMLMCFGPAVVPLFLRGQERYRANPALDARG